MSKVPPHILEKRVCYKCRINGLYVIIRRKYYDKNGDWTGEYICEKCRSKDYQKNDPNSQHNTIKVMRNWRCGHLDTHGEIGKSVIGQWMGGKTLGLKDTNIENDNFKEYVDLSKHHIYGNIEVKIRSLDIKKNCWSFLTIRMQEYDNMLLLCMDSNNPWKDIERVYIIPWDVIVNRGKTAITIIKSILKDKWYEEFRIDEKPFNLIYHGVDIPRIFNPRHLWDGMYNI